MRLPVVLSALVLSAPLTQAAQFPACVETCIMDNASSSWCDGGETGEQLAECTCAGLQGSPMISCIHKCPSSDQDTYAQGLPDLCRSNLFPNAASPTTTSSGGSGATEAPTGTSTESPSNSSTESPSTTSSGTPTGSETPTETPGAAVGIEVPKMVLAGGLLAALLV